MSSLEFRLKKIDETRHYLLEEIKHNDLMSESIKRHVCISIMLNTTYFSFSSY